MSTPDDNRALVRRLVEVVNARDLDAIGEDNLTRMRQLGLAE